MNKEELEKLIESQPKEIRAKAVLLFNGAATCAEQYRKNPTSSNLRDWEAAQAALAKFAAQIGGVAGEEKPLPTIAEVLEHLTAAGWRGTKTSLYRHQKEGKLLPGPDGSYKARDVEKYARTWLRQLSTGKRVSEKMDELQRKKIELELQNLDLERKRKELAYGKELDRYIPRELMEIELAGRAGVLDAGLKHWVQSHAAEWIRSVGGDTGKVGDLIGLMSRELDEHLNSYAAAIEYRVVVSDDEEPPEPSEGDRSGEEGASC